MGPAISPGHDIAAILEPSTQKAHYHCDANSPEFAAATQRWNNAGAPQFGAAVSPADEDEVAMIVKFCRNDFSDIDFLATGGRHGYSPGLRNMRKGLAIDLRRLNQVTIDKENSTVTVGGGAQIRDVLKPVYEAGFQIPAGSCNSVGFVGATIGGGVGISSGRFGLMIDSLLSARMVTAAGELVDVSEGSNPDLFWAIRGAGANFGVITSATYKLHRQVNDGLMVFGDLIFPMASKEAYFRALEDLQESESWPAELALFSTIIWDPESSSTAIACTFTYMGSETDASSILEPFFRLGPLVAQKGTAPFYQIPYHLLLGQGEAMSNQKEQVRSIHSLNVRRLCADTYISATEKFDDFYKEHPNARGSVCMMETFPNHATAAVPSDATAYPWRDAIGNFIFNMTWGDDPNDAVAAEAINTFARNLRDDYVATSGYPDLSTYVSYSRDDETLEQVYGEDKLPRLLQLKKEWDPENAFRHYHPLLSTESSSK